MSRRWSSPHSTRANNERADAEAREATHHEVPADVGQLDVTGPAEVMLADAEALRSAGHTVHLACDTRRPGNLVETIRGKELTLLDELVLCRSPGAVEVWHDVRALRARMVQERYDLVHCRSPTTTSSPWPPRRG